MPTLPTFEEAVLGKKVEAQDADDIAAVMDHWMVMHNAKLASNPEWKPVETAVLVEE